ncbi:MAG TPA: hypothetical protein VMV69_09655 [Pirellulales bacterium]|nr:hypothetical protein [Pirellulales bacterium]
MTYLPFHIFLRGVAKPVSHVNLKHMAAENSSSTHHPDGGNAGALGDWHTGELPAPPSGGWHTWAQLLGPGVLLAGASIGSGEWLSGPAVSAQYGATLLWVATLSIVTQAFCNLDRPEPYPALDFADGT